MKDWLARLLGESLTLKGVQAHAALGDAGPCRLPLVACEPLADPAEGLACECRKLFVNRPAQLRLDPLHVVANQVFLFNHVTYYYYFLPGPSR